MNDLLQRSNEENLLLRKENLSLQSKIRVARESGNLGDSNVQLLQRQIDVGFLRRDPAYVKIIFDQYSDKYVGSIRQDKLHSALAELGVEIDVMGTEELFQEFDSDVSGGLNLEEFQQLLLKSTRLFEWSKGLPLHELLADAIPRRPGQDPLKVISELTVDDIAVTCQAMVEGLIKIVHQGSACLKQAFQAWDQRERTDGASKFNVVALSCGQIADFHLGIEERIGTKLIPCIYIYIYIYIYVRKRSCSPFQHAILLNHK